MRYRCPDRKDQEDEQHHYINRDGRCDIGCRHVVVVDDECVS